MKIIHVHQFFNDGYAYQENILPKYQQKMGETVALITSEYGNSFNDRQAPKLGEYESDGFRIKRIPTKLKFTDRFVIFKNLYGALESEAPDYIYHHSPCAFSLITCKKYIRNHPNTKLFVDNHADWTISGRNKLWLSFYYRFLWRLINASVKRYVTLYFGVTPGRCSFLEKELKIPKEKIRLLPIGADTDEVCSLEKITKAELAAKYNLDPEKTWVVSGGKMSKTKKTDRLIEAFKKANLQNSQLLLFGKFEEESYFLNKLDDNVKFLGWLSHKETLQLMRVSDLGVWNSQHTTLIEDAIAAELPLILRYYCSTAHLIKNNGLYLYGPEEQELREALAKTITGKNVLKSLKLGAVAQAKTLSYNEIARETIEYFYNPEPKSIHVCAMSNKTNQTNTKNYWDISKDD